MAINFASRAEIMGKKEVAGERGEEELCKILTNGIWENISKLFHFYQPVNISDN